MIVIKNVPGLTTTEVMAAIADKIPLAEVETGYGGIVVDERTALVFLTRYLSAVDNEPLSQEAGQEESSTVRASGRKKRGVTP